MALQQGEIRVAGHIHAGLTGDGNTDEAGLVGNPSLKVPFLSLGGSLYAGVAEQLELGVSGAYSNGRLASAGLRGHAFSDFPSNENPHVGRLAAGLRLNLNLPRGFTVALLLESGASFVANAHFACSQWTDDLRDDWRVFGEDAEPVPCTTADDFVFARTSRHFPWFGAASVHMVWNPSDEMALYAVVQISGTPTNVGYSMRPAPDRITLAPAVSYAVGHEWVWERALRGLQVAAEISDDAALGALLGVQAGWRRQRPGRD